MLHHPCILGGPQQREQNRKSKPTPGVTMMHHARKRGFKDCPGFLNSTGRLGPKRGRIVPVSSMLHHPCILGGPQQREQNRKSKPTPGVTMMHHATKRGFKDCPKCAPLAHPLKGHRWGTGPKRCPARARRANVRNEREMYCSGAWAAPATPAKATTSQDLTGIPSPFDSARFEGPPTKVRKVQVPSFGFLQSMDRGHVRHV